MRNPKMEEVVVPGTPGLIAGGGLRLRVVAGDDGEIHVAVLSDEGEHCSIDIQVSVPLHQNLYIRRTIEDN